MYGMILAMPITTSAKKALRGSARKKAFNDARKNVMKTATKSVKKFVSTKNVKEAEAALAKAYQAIDKAAKKGVIKKNTASRKKSRLMAAIKKASAK